MLDKVIKTLMLATIILIVAVLLSKLFFMFKPVPKESQIECTITITDSGRNEHEIVGIGRRI